ncbi:MAG TPA: NADH-quinone oxidoreductase subunit C [Candidatus Thermoplasmatota archaeon]|nr:NADH-quinone oxidoreductase subunit C [Candidatus Thermoplasmatota archaeon]
MSRSLAVDALPEAADVLLASGARLACIAAKPSPEGGHEVTYLFVGAQGNDTLAVRLPRGAALPSLARDAPAAMWFERELHEVHGLAIAGHPAMKPLLAHAGWPGGAPDFPFRRVEGEGVYEVPVGPIHAGVIEPGHFRFSLAGERVLDLEIRLGYVHRGVERLMEGRSLDHALVLAARTSGDNSAAHALAFSQAVEGLAGVEVPERALYLRSLLVELERVTNHLADVGGVLLDVAWNVGWARLAALREDLLRAQADLTSSRLLYGAVRPGGVGIAPEARDLDALAARVEAAARAFAEVVAASLEKPSVVDRLETTGKLPREDALALGCVGPTARASGIDLDARRQWPHAAYPKLTFDVPVERDGDVLARVRVKTAEAQQSAGMIRQCAASLPGGPVLAPIPQLEPGRWSWAAAEAHRGEVIYGVEADAQGRVARCRIRDPSFMDWPALERAVPRGNILADFPVVNKSFNLSYAGYDR